LCKELAKTEADLEKIREHDAFKQLINWSELPRVWTASPVWRDCLPSWSEAVERWRCRESTIPR
jgi:hypothetical protein